MTTATRVFAFLLATIAVASLVYIAVITTVRLSPTRSGAQSMVTADSNLEIRLITADQRILYRRVDNKIVCSEPSPDATIDTVQANASGVDLAFGRTVLLNGNADLNARAANQVSSTPIFKRSQTIQYFRDSMFFLCQAYMNGAIKAEDYQRRHDDLVQKGYNSLQAELVAQAPRMLPLPPEGETRRPSGQK